MSSFAINTSAFDRELIADDTSFSNYKDLLFDIYYNTYKYCELAYYQDDFNCDHLYGIADINNDGIDELIVQFYCGVMAAQYMAVWTYDREIKKVKFFDFFDELTEFYTTGYAITYWSHNQTSHLEYWPYSIYKIQPHDSPWLASAWAEDLNVPWLDSSYDKSYDLDNDGILYFFKTNDDESILTYDEIRSIEETYVPDSALIHFVLEEIYPSAISTLEADYGKDLSDSGNMMGDINSDNIVTAADARLALRFAANIDIPTLVQKKLADVDKNDSVTASDARKILRVAARIDPPFEPEDFSSTIYDSPSFNGIYIDYADNVLQYFDEFEYFVADDTLYSEKVMFYADKTLYDFTLYTVAMDESYSYSYIDEEYYIGDITPEHPVMIKMEFHEIYANYAVSFCDEEGNYYVCSINMSGEDDSLSLYDYYK